MKGLLFTRSDAGTLYFTELVVGRMLAYRQYGRHQNEAGGVLLGRLLLDCDDVIVDQLTEPVRTDRRSWTGFFRSLAHQALAFQRWRHSGGHCAYLGLWHTHPESDPRPSRTDLDDWRHALSRDRFDGTALFFVIVGTHQLRAWQGDKGSVGITELALTAEK
jgi:integrative and conjugative element protein (TIGR02256 family)